MYHHSFAVDPWTYRKSYSFVCFCFSLSCIDGEHGTFPHTEIGLIYYVSVMISPSMLAASAVFAARCTLEKNPVWDETLRVYTGYSEAQLLLVNIKTLPSPFGLNMRNESVLISFLILLSKQELCQAPGFFPFNNCKQTIYGGLQKVFRA